MSIIIMLSFKIINEISIQINNKLLLYLKNTIYYDLIPLEFHYFKKYRFKNKSNLR